jgi:hypothetical protein
VRLDSLDAETKLARNIVIRSTGTREFGDAPLLPRQFTAVDHGAPPFARYPGSQQGDKLLRAGEWRFDAARYMRDEAAEMGIALGEDLAGYPDAYDERIHAGDDPDGPLGGLKAG